MKKHDVWKAIPKNRVPADSKVLSSTWAMKKKSNGTYRARLNARGFEQVDGEHYDSQTKAAPVVNEATIFIVLILMVMGDLYGELMDVCGAFLNGEFSRGEVIYMSVPQGFEKYYGKDVLLLLKKTIYGLKQAAYAYWVVMLKAIKKIGLERSKADPCLYFRWTKNGLHMMASWVDDLMNVAIDKRDVEDCKQKFKGYFEIDELGIINEYVGCKIEFNRQEGWLKMTQPVLLQSFSDEFEMPGGRFPVTPAVPGSVQVEGENKVGFENHAKYRTGVGKLIHLSKFTRPEILNSVRELARFTSGPSEAHMCAMIRCMHYCVGTPTRGITLKPDTKWDGSRNFKFTISGQSDSDYAKCPTTRRSVSGYSAFLNGAPYTRKSKMQEFVTMSVTEAEAVSATACAQDMLFGMRLLESMGLGVNKPMILRVDNRGGC
jgi:hypothetical protein